MSANCLILLNSAHTWLCVSAFPQAKHDKVDNLIQSICSIPGPVEILLNVDPLWNLLVPNGAVCSALGRAFWTANLGIEYATLQVLFSICWIRPKNGKYHKQRQHNHHQPMTFLSNPHEPARRWPCLPWEALAASNTFCPATFVPL